MRKEKNPLVFFNPSAGFRELRDNSKKGSHAKCGGCCSRTGTLKATSLSDEETEAQDVLSDLPSSFHKFLVSKGQTLNHLPRAVFLSSPLFSKPNVLNDNSGTRLARSGLGGGGGGRPLRTPHRGRQFGSTGTRLGPHPKPSVTEGRGPGGLYCCIVLILSLDQGSLVHLIPHQHTLSDIQ